MTAHFLLPFAGHGHVDWASFSVGDWVLLGASALFVAWTIWRAIDLTVHPGEEEPTHIKRVILPRVLTVPEIEPERFYHFQLVDLYAHNFAYVGTLTTGNGAGKYLIAGPDWDGEKPEGISNVFQSEADFVINITRTQLFGADDLVRVQEIQGSYDLQPLSAFLGKAAPAAAPTWRSAR